MAIALVGTIGVVSTGASGAAVTPAWGTGENRTANNLLTLQVSVTGSATLPATPTGWTISKQQAGTSCSASIFFKIATGADAAPTVAAVTSGIINARLAEYSGAEAGLTVIGSSGGVAGTTSPLVATNAAADQASGSLMLSAVAMLSNGSRTVATWTETYTNATANATSNASTTTGSHYGFSYGVTTANASANSDSFAFTIGNLTGVAVVLASFDVLVVVQGLEADASLSGLIGQAIVNEITQPSLAASAALTPVGLVTEVASAPLVANAGMNLAVSVNQLAAVTLAGGTSLNVAAILTRTGVVAESASAGMTTAGSVTEVASIAHFAGATGFYIGVVVELASVAMAASAAMVSGNAMVTEQAAVALGASTAMSVAAVVTVFVIIGESSGSEMEAEAVVDVIVSVVQTATSGLQADAVLDIEATITQVSTSGLTADAVLDIEAQVSQIAGPGLTADATVDIFGTVGAVVEAGMTVDSSVDIEASIVQVASPGLEADASVDIFGDASEIGISTLEAHTGLQLRQIISQPSGQGPLETSGALVVSNFGPFAGLSPAAAINAVTFQIAQHGSAGGLAPTYQLWDGASSQIGTAQTGTASTSTSNIDIVTFTGATFAQLATMALRIYASGNTGATLSVDSVGVTVNATEATSVVFIGSSGLTIAPLVTEKAGVTLAATAGMAVAPVQKFATLVDNFSSGSLDPALWSHSVSNTAIVSGQLQISSTTTAVEYQVFSQNFYDLTNSQVIVQLVNPGNQAINSWESYPLLVQDVGGTNQLYWYVLQGFIACYKSVAGVQTQLFSEFYSTDYLWLSIRESAGVTYFEFSPDGITWVQAVAVADPINETSLRLIMQAGTYNPETLTTAVLLDNVNSQPSGVSMAAYTFIFNIGASVTEVATVAEAASAGMTVAATSAGLSNITLAGGAALNVSALVTERAVVTEAASAGLSTTATVTEVATVSEAATAAMTVAATASGLSNVTLAGGAALNVAAKVTEQAVVTMAASAGATISGTRAVLGSVPLAGTAGMNVTAFQAWFAPTALSGTAGLSITAYQGWFVAPSLAATSTMTVTGFSGGAVSILITALSTLVLSPVDTVIAQVSMAAGAAWTSIASVTEVASMALTGLAALAVYAGPPHPPVTGYLGWYDASQITGQADGSLLASWPDLSGNNHHLTQTASANQPTYYKTTPAQLVNHLPAVWFDGVNSYLQWAAGDTIAPISVLTWFVVLKDTRGTGSVFLDGVSSGNRISLLDYRGEWEIYNGAEIFFANADTNLHVLGAVYNGANSYFDLDGVANGPVDATAGGTPSTWTGLMAGTYPNITYMFQGVMCEVIVYPSALTTPQRQSVESYLTNKWLIAPITVTEGVTAGLTISALATEVAAVAQSATSGMAMTVTQLANVTLAGGTALNVVGVAVYEGAVTLAAGAALSPITTKVTEVAPVAEIATSVLAVTATSAPPSMYPLLAAYNSGSTTSTTASIILPTGIAFSDLILIFLTISANDTVTTPSGYVTTVARTSAVYTYVYSRVSDGTDSGATVAMAISGASRWVAEVRVYQRGQVDVASTSVNASGTAAPYAALTPTTANDLAVAYVGTIGAATTTASTPIGYGNPLTVATSASSNNLVAASWDQGGPLVVGNPYNTQASTLSAAQPSAAVVVAVTSGITPPPSTSLRGNSGMTLAASVHQLAGVTMADGSALTVTGVATKVGAVALGASAAAVMTAAPIHELAVVAMTGTGLVTMTPGGAAAGVVAFSATASLSPVFLVTRFVPVALVATSVLIASSAVKVLGPVVLSGTSSLITATRVTHMATVSLTETSHLVTASSIAYYASITEVAATGMIVIATSGPPVTHYVFTNLVRPNANLYPYPTVD